MQRLTWRKLLAGERGAVVALLAILLGSGFLLVSVGLVIDGGRLFLERRVLQASADNLAVSVAQACAAYDANPALAAAADCQDPPSNLATAADLGTSGRIPNEANQTEAYKVCGTSAALTACSAGSIGTYECKSPVDPVSGSTFAHVARTYTRTTTAGATGGTALYPLFAPLLQANPTGTRLAACSQAAWVYRSIGKKPNTQFMPFAISTCEYSLTPKVISGYGTGTTSCATENDQDGHETGCDEGGCGGGFVGFYNSAPAGCPAYTAGKLSLFGTTNTIGAPSSGICVKATVGTAPSPTNSNLVKTIAGNISAFPTGTTPEDIYSVPLYDKATKPGSYNLIRIAGFGYFKLLGYKFPGTGNTYVAAGYSAGWPANCGASGGAANTWCIYGYFEPHVFVNSPSSELVEIARPTFWDHTFAVKRIP